MDLHEQGTQQSVEKESPRLGKNAFFRSHQTMLLPHRHAAINQQIVSIVDDTVYNGFGDRTVILRV
jgi:hypothetical protein